MRSVVSTCMERIRNERKARIRLASVLLLLAIVVTIGVYWRLHYTGIAMVNETYCGSEEHQHDRSCYTRVLSCGLEEGGESAHTHDRSCYETVTALICGLEEGEGHSHGEECLDADGNIICGLEESSGHVHDGSCYAEEQVKICGLPETDGGHVHTDSCFTTVLTCEIPEHVHSGLCMSDLNADTETAGDWEATLPDEIPDNRAEAVVAIARSQIGYTESAANFRLDDDGVTRKGYTRYGAWYGSPYGDWGAMFVSFCLSYAGVPEEEFPEAAGAYAWVTELERMESEDREDGTGELNLYMAAGDCVPAAGDLIFFDRDGDERADHVGIVEETETDDDTGGETVTAVKTIEGDCDGAVRENVYDPEDGTILGYGILPEDPDMEEEDPGNEMEDAECGADVGDGADAGDDADVEDGADGTDAEYDADAEDVTNEGASEEEDAAEIGDQAPAVSDEMDGDAEPEEPNEPDASGDPRDSGEPEEDGPVIYTAEDGGVAVQVVLPEGALPEGAELAVTIVDEDSEEYAEAQSLVEEASDIKGITDITDAGSEDSCSIVVAVNETDENGNSDAAENASDMVLLDISFLLGDEEVEPSGPADVTIDVTALIGTPDEDAVSLNVWHLEETDGGPSPVLVAETTSDDDMGFGVAEFPVESFSNFAVHWFPNSGNFDYFGQIRVYLYDADAEEDTPIAGKTDTLDYFADVNESIELAAGSNFINSVGVDRTQYLFSYATVTSNKKGDGTGDSSVEESENRSSRGNPVKYVKLGYVTTSPSYTWTYTFYGANDASGNESVLYSYTEVGRKDSEEPSLNLYFTSEPYVITWVGNNGTSYVSYETRDMNTRELLGGSGSWSKDNTSTDITMSSNGLLEKVSLGSGYTYVYATVYDPATGSQYGSLEDPVTAVGGGAKKSGDGSDWTFTIKYADGTTDTIIKTYAAVGEDDFDPSRDLLITLYYYGDDGNACVALESKNGSMNYGGRDYVYGLEKYAVNNKVTISLPDNDSLGDPFIVYEDEDNGDVVLVNATKIEGTNGYKWRVVGWYNIGDGNYYDVSEGPAENVEIDLSNRNVFYADVVAASYDMGSSSDAGLVGSESTADFVTVKFYDYNELFNLYSSYLLSCSITGGEEWDAGVGSSGGNGKMFTVPVLTQNTDDLAAQNKVIGNSFIFLNEGAGKGTLADPYDLNYWNEWTGSLVNWGTLDTKKNRPAANNVISAENWGITNSGGKLLDMLFDDNSKSLGVHYIGDADGLFQYGTDLTGDLTKYNGYYYYSSSLNAAAYNQSEGRIYLYSDTEKYDSYTMFLPFNQHKTSYYDSKEIDYNFGMSMEVEFYLPYPTGTQDDEGNYLNLVDGEDMKFNFTGDDDIMVFVDDELVLDMAGIHDEADGWIDFATGEFEYYCINQAGQNKEIDPGRYGTHWDYELEYFLGFIIQGGHSIETKEIRQDRILQLEAGTHKLTVYYLERGAGASNLTVSFNIVPSWRYYSDKTTTVTVEKKWSDGSGGHADDPVTMGLFKKLLDSDGYVYSAVDDGAELTIGEEKYYFADGSDHCLDDDKNIIAIREGIDEGDPRFFLRVEETPIGTPGKQVLNEENNWKFAWELLENNREYRVLEITGPDGYFSTSSVSQFGEWEYWHIIGEDELERMYEEYAIAKGNGKTVDQWVILTDAASSWDGTREGYPQGYVVRNNPNNLVSVTFSMVPDWSRSTDSIIAAEFGDVADSQIENLTDSSGNVFVKWKVVFTGEESADDEYTNPEGAHTFYLESQIKDTGGYRYLRVKTDYDEDTGSAGSLDYVHEQEKATVFYVDALGELRVENRHERIVIEDDGSGNYVLKVIPNSDGVESGDNNHNIRVYALSSVSTYGYSYTFVNTPRLTLMKADHSTGEFLEGAVFTLRNSDGDYYTINDDGTCEWTAVGAGDPPTVSVESGEGLTVFLEDGTYILTEVRPPDGYLLLSDPIVFAVENGVFAAPSGAGDNTWDISDNCFILTVYNFRNGTELPSTGGAGKTIFTSAGILLISASAALFYIKKKRVGEK